MTLTDFLLARIAEDEAAAQDEIERMKRWPAPGIGARYTLSLAHRFTPARVLAECEAKRRIVEMHNGAAQAVETISAADDGSPGADLALGVVKSVLAIAEAAIKIHAATHADHPDYDEEWRP